jgi:predicted lactoylglutathione lyase
MPTALDNGQRSTRKQLAAVVRRLLYALRVVLLCNPWDELAEDARVSSDGVGFRGVTLAQNVRSKERVDEVLAEAERAGGNVVKPGQPTPWGGYGGYFADPEGHLWEVATGATQLPFSE